MKIIRHLIADQESIASLKTAKVKYVDSGLWSKAFFDRMVALDPSPTKKYLDWICAYFWKEWKDVERVVGFIKQGGDTPKEVDDHLMAIGEIIGRLHEMSMAHLIPSFDMNRFPLNLSELSIHLDAVTKTSGERAWGLNKLKLGVDYNRVKENQEWIVYEILNYKASRVLGSGTPWCVVANEEHYRNYTKEGEKVFFFVVNKKNFYHKYAVLVPTEFTGDFSLGPFKLDPSVSSYSVTVTLDTNQEVDFERCFSPRTGFNLQDFVPSRRTKMSENSFLGLLKKEIGASSVKLTQLSDGKTVFFWEGEGYFRSYFWAKFFDPEVGSRLFTSEFQVIFRGVVSNFELFLPESWNATVQSMEAFSRCLFGSVKIKGCTLDGVKVMPRVDQISFEECRVLKPFQVRGVGGKLEVYLSKLDGSVFNDFRTVSTDSVSVGSFSVIGSQGDPPSVTVRSFSSLSNITTVMKNVPHYMRINIVSHTRPELRIDLPETMLTRLDVVKETSVPCNVVFTKPIEVKYLEKLVMFPSESGWVLIDTPDGTLGPLPGLDEIYLNGLVVSPKIPILKVKGEAKMGLSFARLTEVRLPDMGPRARFFWNLDLVPDNHKHYTSERVVFVPNPEFQGLLVFSGSTCPSWLNLIDHWDHHWLRPVLSGLVKAGYDTSKFYLRGIPSPKKFFDNLVRL